MTMINRGLLTLMITLSVACSTVRVSEDFDPNADFSSMNSFAWKHDEQPRSGDIRLDDPLLNQRIRAAIDETLAARYSKVEREAADFLVAYELGIRQKIRSDDTHSGVMIGTGRRGTFGGFGIGTGSAVESYDQGMLFIDVLDPKSGKLLWRGKGTDVLSEHADPAAVTEQVYEIVEKILAKFPPT